MFPGIGIPELIILGVVAVLLFGKRLPEVARSLGGSYREFRRGLSELQSTIDLDRPGMFTASKAAEPEVDDDDQPTAPRLEPPAEQLESAGPKLPSA